MDKIKIGILIGVIVMIISTSIVYSKCQKFRGICTRWDKDEYYELPKEPEPVEFEDKFYRLPENEEYRIITGPIECKRRCILSFRWTCLVWNECD